MAWVLAAALLTPALASAGPPRGDFTGARPAHWRVTWTMDPAREATVSWDTAEAGTDHTVYYDRAPRHGKLEAYAQKNSAKSGRYTPNAEQADLVAHYHHAELRGLEPDAMYYFAVVSDGAASPEFHFRTAPVDDAEFQILYGGDSRTQTEFRQAMNRLVAGLVSKNPDVLALIHGGDYIEHGDELDEWLEWLADQELIVTDDRRILPIIPARGNHDVGPIFDEVFNTPGGTYNYYATSLGPQCRLITLNTQISTAGDQASWLREELAHGRAQSRWLTAQYHRPAWPAYKEPSGARRHWVPMFEEFNVDLVMESDGHVLKRTLPIRNDRHDPTGVTYIGEGGLGVRPRTPKRDLWYLQPPGFADSGHHIHLLTFTRDALRLRAIMLDGAVRDDWRLSPRGAVGYAGASR